MNHHCVYVLQLGPDPMNVYVGSTGLTREERLAKHVKGEKAAKVTRRYVARGLDIVLRPDLYPPNSTNITYAEAARLESSWAHELRGRGYHVHGGT
jgi:hypothetical protein